MSKGKSPNVDPSLLFYKHGVPKRAGIIGCVDPMPRLPWGIVLNQSGAL